MIETIKDLLLSNWQIIAVAILIIIAFIVNIIDRTHKSKIDWFCPEMPYLQPIPIETKGHGFWKAIWIWIMTTRTWYVSKDFHYSIDGINYVIPKGFVFDGASVPKFFRSWLSPMGVLLIAGLIHDYGYKYGELRTKGKSQNRPVTRAKMDKIFREINIEDNGFKTLNYIAWYGVRLGGWIPWILHRNDR